MDAIVAAVDIGGTKTAAALVDGSGSVRARRSAPTPARLGPEAVLSVAAQLVRELRAEAPDTGIRALGIGTAGVVDVARGTIISSTDTFADWVGTAVGERLRVELGAELCPGAPIHVQNDVDAYALGELQAGAARGADSMLLVAVGTGIGASVVVGGRVLSGAHHVAGEIAHLPVPGAEHLLCPCGRVGHLEAIGSGAGIHRHFLSLGGAAGDGLAVARRAEQGEPLALRALADSGAAVGRGLAAAMTLLDPACVVLSGSVAVPGGIWWRAAEASLREQLVDVLQATPLVPGALGADAPLIGAAHAARTLIEGAP